MDNDQKEYGGCVSWKATKAVVLAGGVFNTFDLLPTKSLKTRDIPKYWWMPNEEVGQGLGEEHSVLFLYADRQKADPYGAQPRLIARNKDSSSFQLWTKGALTWLRYQDTDTNMLLGTITSCLDGFR